MNIDFGQIISFLTDPELPRIVWIVKTVFISISLILMFFIVFLVVKASWFKHKYLDPYTEFFKQRPFGTKEEFKRWSKINKRIESGSKAEYKMAVIEADDALKDTLKKMKYEGEFLEDILKKVNSRVLPSEEKVKKAHEARNKIMHDPDYDLTQEQAKNILNIYHQAFRELEMIL